MPERTAGIVSPLQDAPGPEPKQTHPRLRHVSRPNLTPSPALLKRAKRIRTLRLPQFRQKAVREGQVAKRKPEAGQALAEEYLPATAWARVARRWIACPRP